MSDGAYSADLLHAICEHLPAADADLVRTLDPADHLTYVEAYSIALRAGVQLPYDLRRRVMASLWDITHSDTPGPRGGVETVGVEQAPEE